MEHIIVSKYDLDLAHFMHELQSQQNYSTLLDFGLENTVLNRLVNKEQMRFLNPRELSSVHQELRFHTGLENRLIAPVVEIPEKAYCLPLPKYPRLRGSRGLQEDIVRGLAKEYDAAIPFMFGGEGKYRTKVHLVCNANLFRSPYGLKVLEGLDKKNLLRLTSGALRPDALEVFSRYDYQTHIWAIPLAEARGYPLNSFIPGQNYNHFLESDVVINFTFEEELWKLCAQLDSQGLNATQTVKEKHIINALIEDPGGKTKHSFTDATRAIYHSMDLIEAMMPKIYKEIIDVHEHINRGSMSFIPFITPKTPKPIMPEHWNTIIFPPIGISLLDPNYQSPGVNFEHREIDFTEFEINYAGGL